MTRLTVAEHEVVRVAPDGPLTAAQLRHFQRFYEQGHTRYYTLTDRGIRLRQYVGLLRLGNLELEILPKIGQQHPPTFWRQRLLELLAICGELPRFAPTYAHLRPRPGELLQRYLHHFADQVQRLLQQGLQRTYRMQRRSSPVLRGRWQLSEQLRRSPASLTEFQVVEQRYDRATLANQLIAAALPVARGWADTPALVGSLDRSYRDWPATAYRGAVDEELFNRVLAAPQPPIYRSLLMAARRILLSRRPSLQPGGAEGLALLFDVNRLWETFVGRALRGAGSFTLLVQPRRTFWRAEQRTVDLRPDFLIQHDGQCYILDAKWKQYPDGQPSAADLRQVYVYAREFGASRAALVVPGAGPQVEGAFPRSGLRGELLYLPVADPRQDWLAVCRRLLAEWTAR